MGLPLPVDRGKHRVVAKAPGRATWETTVDVAGGAAVASITVPELAATSVAPTPEASPPPPEPIAPPPPSDQVPPGKQGGSSSRKMIGYGAVGLGAVGLVVGGVLGLSAMSKKSDAEDGHCTNGNHCDQEGVDLLNASLDAGNLATIFVIAGAAIATTGVVLVATAPKDDPGAALVIGPANVALVGRFR